MSWMDRINETIDFISPDGDEFSGYWIGGTRSGEKKLGIFDYPKVSGSKIQDLDIKAIAYPITFFFEGADHDKEAERFFTACAQRGPWQVDHPVKGRKSLQWVSFQEDIQPVVSGNVTQITVDTLETSDAVTPKSTAQMAAEVEDQAEIVKESAASQFAEVKTDTFSKLKAVKKAVSKAVGVVRENVQGLQRLVADINAQVDAIQRGIQDTMDAVIFEPLKLASQVQQLIELPSLVMDDFTARFQAYKAFANDLFGDSASNATDETLNKIKSKELAVSGALSTVAKIGATSTFKTRAQMIEAMEDITSLFDEAVSNLDADQEVFKDNRIDHQYFSQSESFADTARMIAMVQALLIKQSFDLAIEKKITLDRPRTPVEIAMTEYGGMGENDSNIDLFIESNGLEGNDLLILYPGREVVVYV